MMNEVIRWERNFRWMMEIGEMTFKNAKQAKDMQKEFADVGIDTVITSHYGRKFTVALKENN